MMVSDNSNHKHEYDPKTGLCRCGAYRGFIKKRKPGHEVPRLVTIIECSSCNGKGKNTRGCRCIECNGTGTVRCEE